MDRHYLASLCHGRQYGPFFHHFAVCDAVGCPGACRIITNFPWIEAFIKIMHNHIDTDINITFLEQRRLDCPAHLTPGKGTLS